MRPLKKQKEESLNYLLYEFKMRQKAVEMVRNINYMHLVQGWLVNTEFLMLNVSYRNSVVEMRIVVIQRVIDKILPLTKRNKTMMQANPQFESLLLNLKYVLKLLHC